MKHLKLISLLLAVLLMLGSLSVLGVIGASAAEEEDKDTSTDKKEEVVVEETIDYIKQVYTHPEQKRDTMELYLTKGNYKLYVDTFSGEVAYENVKTGEILFTNPYDIATSTTGSDSTKGQLLSQIIIKYTDNNTSPEFESYEMAALKDQITVKRIKNGVRVQYTLGREQARKLVPGMISAERYVEMITGPAKENGINDFLFGKLDAYYLLKSLDTVTSERARAELIEAFPIVEKMDVYVFHLEATENERNIVEGLIKTYCPEYTYEELDFDHAQTEFVSQDKNPPLFKLSLEYTLDEYGMSVRLPANGIRFNESLYALESIQVLPYMGAGNSAYSGYTFFPDGSGSLFAFDTLETTNPRNVNGKVYGNDYAYHTITDTYQQPIRYPVFGVVENSVYYDFTKVTEDATTGEQIKDTTRLSGSIVDQVNRYNASISGTQDSIPTLVKEYGALIGSSTNIVTKHEIDRGYVAIMEEGDALTDIRTFHAGSLSDYNSIKMIFNPRPSDSYNLQDSISVGSDSTWTVVSERKYVGNYKIRYVMLSDNELAAEKGVEDYYEASWMGMAFAYRDYLDRGGYLTRLTAEQLQKDIPLYIESFGALETTERIMSIPVDVMTPLTTFENVQTMYDELAEAGVTNINFKLTGFANGGMYSIVPSKLKWEKAVGGKDGFQALVDYAAQVNAKENSNLGIFPDFDFAYINATDTFDGVSLRLHAVKTIDDRYASYREYSATQQKHVSHYQLAISPAAFNKFYEKLAANYLKYDNVNGISVSTLGNSLNSDFDEDDPYNREDSKEFTATALEYLSSLKNNQGQEVKVMAEGGNAFTWKYLDHLIDVSLDSSRSNDAAHSVPFIGVVLHGYINFAGSPMNMEGNISYAMLKAMENGAAPYYILSYQNTQNLKDYYLLSHYYSVRYDIWKDDVVELYHELNGVLGDVQDKLIIDHEFWTGTRVPDSDELQNDLQAVLDKFLYEEENAGEVLALKDKQAVSIARKQAREAAEAAMASLDDAAAAFKQANDMYTPFLSDIEQLKGYFEGNAVPAGYDHVCGEDAWTKAEDAEAKAAAEARGEEYVSHVCGYKAFIAVNEDGSLQLKDPSSGKLIYAPKYDYASYEKYADAEEGTKEYELYQLFLSFNTTQARYSTARNRRLNDLVNIYNYYTKAQTAFDSIQVHLDNAVAAVELIAATEGMLPELIEESTSYRDMTQNYLSGSSIYALADRYKQDGDIYTVADDIKAIEEYIRAAIAAEQVEIDKKLAEDKAAAWDNFLTEWGKAFAAIVPGIEEINNKLDKDTAAVDAKLKADVAEVWAQFMKDWGEAFAGINPGTEEIEKILAETVDAINKKLNEETLPAIPELTEDEIAERKQNNEKVANELFDNLAPIYAELQLAIQAAKDTYTDETVLAIVLEKLNADAQTKIDQYNLEAVRKMAPVSEAHAQALAAKEIRLLEAIAQADIQALNRKPNELYVQALDAVAALTLPAEQEIAALQKTAEEEIAALKAKPDELHAATVEEIAKLEKDALEDKKTFTLTDESTKEIKALCHFKYDYAKNQDKDITAFGQYILGEMIYELTGEENPYPYVELDFEQASFTTHAGEIKKLYDSAETVLKNFFTEAEIAARITPMTSGGTIVEEEEEEVFDKYAVEEGSIVVVTYGGKNGVDADPYKSIILNYNNFSVSIVYEDMVYTIPAYGYVVVMK